MRSSDAIPSFDWGDIVVNLSVVRLTYCPLGPKTKTAKGGHMIHTHKKKNITNFQTVRGNTQINSKTLVAMSNVHVHQTSCYILQKLHVELHVNAILTIKVSKNFDF